MREGFDIDGEISDMRTNISTDMLEDEKTRLMTEFMNEAVKNLETYKKSTKEIQVGNFEIRIQNACEIEKVDPIVDPNPVNLECLTGHFQGEMLAKAVATLTKLSPAPTADIMMTMGECELILEKKISFSIYNECAGSEFEHYYEKYLNEMIGQMEGKGFVYTSDGKGGHMFEKSVVGERIDLQKVESEVVPVN